MKSFRASETERIHSTLHKVEHGARAVKRNEPHLEVEERACALMQERPAEFKTYSEAESYVLKCDEVLASRYVASFGQHKLSPRQARTFGIPDEGDADPTAIAGEEIDRLAQRLQRENPSMNYKECMQRVLDERPDLGKTYAGIR